MSKPALCFASPEDYFAIKESILKIIEEEIISYTYCCEFRLDIIKTKTCYKMILADMKKDEKGRVYSKECAWIKHKLFMHHKMINFESDKFYHLEIAMENLEEFLDEYFRLINLAIFA